MGPRIRSRATAFPDDEGPEGWEDDTSDEESASSDSGSSSDGEEDAYDEEEEGEEEMIPIHVVDGEEYVELYNDIKNIGIRELSFAHAPYVLEKVLEVCKAREDDRDRWCVGNLAQLREVAAFRTGFVGIISSLERLQVLWKNHRVVAVDWDMIGAVKVAVARLPALSDRHPQDLRAEVVKLMERLEATLPVQPDGADSHGANSVEILFPSLVSDVEVLLKDMHEIGLMSIKYSRAELSAYVEVGEGVENEPEEQKPPYIRISSYNEALLAMDSESQLLRTPLCVVACKLSDATKMFNELEKASLKGRWVGNLRILQDTSQFRTVFSRLSESISNVYLTLLEHEIDWFEIQMIKETKDQITTMCDSQTVELRDATLGFLGSIESVLSDFPPLPSDTLTDETEHPHQLIKDLSTKVKQLVDDAKAIEHLKVEYPDAGPPTPLT
uniref:Uncharacterized protein n=1 Tax=Leersia perrieri TaxID=77586 RepID=A0A0D9W9V2_9ORYZ